MTPSEQEKAWMEIMKQFSEIVLDCLDNGTPNVMTVGDHANAVTIEVYRSKDPAGDLAEAVRQGKFKGKVGQPH